MKLLYTRWMREMDAHAIDPLGIPSLVLMENASRGAARWFAEVFPLSGFEHVVVMAGSGNNGGDGMAIARILSGWGYTAEVCLMADPADLNPDPALQYRILRGLDIPVHHLPGEVDLRSILQPRPEEPAFLVDALLGTGITRPVSKGLLATAIQAMNESPLPVAAVDIPSGMSEDFPPGNGFCVRACCTATFHAPKVAHFHPDGNEFCGSLRVVDIGIPPEVEDSVNCHLEFISMSDVRPMLIPRQSASHKGDFGHVLSIAGSREKPGAGILSAYAALRAGAGLSTLALPSDVLISPAMRYPEVMSFAWTGAREILNRLDSFDCVVAGPGLGTGDSIAALIRELIPAVNVPLILDADALNVLDGDLSPLKNATGPVIITPHLGEFRGLTGWSAEEILKDRYEAARRVSREYGIFVVLKGHHTIVASPDGGVRINTTGNPGMATAGSGDVLTGMIAAMIAQHSRSHALDKVVSAAVFLHGFAGDLALRLKGEAGLTAGDLVEAIPAAMCEAYDDPGPFTFQR